MQTPELFSLAGRRALVSGGGRGIGRHLAIGLAEAGADVCIASRNLANCEETAARIEKLGGRAHAFQADLARPEEIDSLVANVLADGDIDVLVNNSARVWAAPTLEYPLEGWDRVFDLNVRGLWHLSQQVARHMADRAGGSIVHIASISAWKAAPDEEQPVIAYNASKGAILALTRDMAVKLAPRGIRVNAIAPGPFATNMMDYLRSDPERLAAYEAGIPARRSGGEDDIKGAVVFLASQASRYVYGHTLIVDGGLSCV